MSYYKIKSITNVKYGKYSDVVRVIAIKERSFFASLFCSTKDVIFITSEDSPLLKQFKSARQKGIPCEIDEDSFFDDLLKLLLAGRPARISREA